MDTPELRTTETKSANATKPTPRRFDLTRLLTQRDRLPWFWFFFTVAVLLLSAMDRYHIVSQFKQRERVVIVRSSVIRDDHVGGHRSENPSRPSITQEVAAWILITSLVAPNAGRIPCARVLVQVADAVDQRPHPGARTSAERGRPTFRTPRRKPPSGERRLGAGTAERTLG